VRENLTLPRLPTSGVTRWLGVGLERKETRPWLDELDVRPRDTEIPISLLSGGNQQKVVLGRWLRCSPKVLVLDEPVHGVDVGAKADILAKLATLARGGHTLVICSSDAEDLASVCDRVLVMRDGRIAADLHEAGLTRDRIVQQTLIEAAA
jgi:ribose transport system ATP-binding protein